MQRLFSTFAGGWPGRGLFVQRLLITAVLFYSAIGLASKGISFTAAIPQVIGVGAGILLLVGLWTPVAGTLVATVELWIALDGGGERSIAIMLAALGASIAMIGPGAWSIDARLFGRKRIGPSKI